jgi:crotonobetainyl-CoA:carnitine CoA-transferase CaiB-like acyl-CoA transferase
MACGDLSVVEFGQGMASSMATMVLADNGASVIKVEPPWGDWSRGEPGFLMWNRGKRSMTLDLRDPSGRDQALQLCARADVVVHASQAGVADRLGIDYDTVATINPAIVYCSIAPMIPGKDLADCKGYEGIVSAMTGRMTGLDRLSGAAPGHDPAEPVFTIAPAATYGASQLAVHGILAAIHTRRSTGRGELVRTSLLQGAMAFLMRQELSRGQPPASPAPPTVHRGIELCFLTARCRDGRYLQMCARQDRHFRQWLETIGLGSVLAEPRYAGVPLGVRRMADLDDLEHMILERMLERPADEWMTLFEANDVGADPFLTPAEFLDQPDMVANGRIAEVEDPVHGRVRMVGALVSLSEMPSRIDAPAPLLGEHTDEIRTQLAERRSQRPAPRAQVPIRERPSPDQQSRPAPLRGITIVESAYFIAGPFATAMLAELGARVIKLEPLAGDPYRRTGVQAAKFVHGKESVAVDLKRDEGAAFLHDLVSRADMFVHSFRPGVPTRLRMDYPRLHSINPLLIYLYAGSYGSRGPQSQRAAFHSTPNALAGGGILQAGLGNRPVDDSYPDPGSALAAATALMLGLAARDATGRGQYLETSMLASTGYILSPNLVRYDGSPSWRAQSADGHQRGLSARYRLYSGSAGWLFVAAVQESEWQALHAATGLRAPGTADEDGEIAAQLERIFSTRSAEEWVHELQDAGVPVALVSDAPIDEWLIKNDFLLQAEHESFGSYWRSPPKIGFSGARSCLGPAADVGEHTRSVLRELGRDDSEIDRLVAAGVFGERRLRNSN